MYDISRREIFKGAERWLKELRDHADPKRHYHVGGQQKRSARASDFADMYGLYFIETSALDGTIVEQAFCTVVDEGLRRYPSGRAEAAGPQPVLLSAEPPCGFWKLQCHGLIPVRSPPALYAPECVSLFRLPASRFFL